MLWQVANGVKRICAVRLVFVIMAMLVMAAGFVPAAGAAAFAAFDVRLSKAAGPLLNRIAADGCLEDCPDCAGCPVEIDILPGPPPGRYDPIAREIERLSPSAVVAGCPSEKRFIAGHPGSRPADPLHREGCGIRCWYWRLRHGYCGPGCEYYSFRLNHFEGRVGRHAGFRHGCPS